MLRVLRDQGGDEVCHGLAAAEACGSPDDALGDSGIGRGNKGGEDREINRSTCLSIAPEQDFRFACGRWA